MRIFNMTNILAKQRGCNAILARNDATNMLAEYFGNNYMYCGWGNKRLGLENSLLANPYTFHANARRGRIRVANRHVAVEMYRRWLWERICADDKAVLASLSQITPTTALVSPKGRRSALLVCSEAGLGHRFGQIVFDDILVL